MRYILHVVLWYYFDMWRWIGKSTVGSRGLWQTDIGLHLLRRYPIFDIHLLQEPYYRYTIVALGDMASVPITCHINALQTTQVSRQRKHTHFPIHTLASYPPIFTLITLSSMQWERYWNFWCTENNIQSTKPCLEMCFFATHLGLSESPTSKWWVNFGPLIILMMRVTPLRLMHRVLLVVRTATSSIIFKPAKESFNWGVVEQCDRRGQQDMGRPSPGCARVGGGTL